MEESPEVWSYFWFCLGPGVAWPGSGTERDGNISQRKRKANRMGYQTREVDWIQGATIAFALRFLFMILALHQMS